MAEDSKKTKRKRYSGVATLMSERECAQCGEKFYIRHQDQWAYRSGGSKFYCSWHCLQESRRKKGKSYSATALASAIGTSPVEVIGWIRTGLIKAQVKTGVYSTYRIAEDEYNRIVNTNIEELRKKYKEAVRLNNAAPHKKGEKHD